MSIFEFIVALYAIIAGLGISELVRSIGQLIEARQRVRRYWVHTVWIALIFMAHISSWFSLWRFTARPRGVGATRSSCCWCRFCSTS